jgi:hypothetical protein
MHQPALSRVTSTIGTKLTDDPLPLGILRLLLLTDPQQYSIARTRADGGGDARRRRCRTLDARVDPAPHGIDLDGQLQLLRGLPPTDTACLCERRGFPG